jgi:hypothetical protein
LREEAALYLVLARIASKRAIRLEELVFSEAISGHDRQTSRCRSRAAQLAPHAKTAPQSPLKPSTGNLPPTDCNQRIAIQPATCNPQPETCNSQLATRNSQLATCQLIARQ